MVDSVKNLTQVISQLRSRSHLSILSNWQRQDQYGEWKTLLTVNSKQNKPILSFLPREENIYIKQVWQVPAMYVDLPTLGTTIRLNLIWWADICEVWVNGEKVQEGDLFDQKCRLLLAKNAKANQEFILEIKLNSTKHDIGALQLSEIVFEYPHQPCDPDKFATELEILQTYIPIFVKHQIDLLPLETATDCLISLFSKSEPIYSDNFLAKLAAIREPLLQYSDFLKQRQIYILGNSHIDVAWLWAIAETKNAMQRTFMSALNLQNNYPELIFNQSTAVSYQWMEQEYPELFSRIQSAVAEGKWELIGGMWVEPDGNLPSGEALIRQILYGQQYFHDQFQKEVKIAWLPDTFGFHWQMPQILLKSGFEAFVTQKLLWNDRNKFPHQIFWWEGVDGSRIFTYFSNELGQGLEPIAITKYLATQEAKHHISETVWLYGVGDHGGGPTADMLDLGREWMDSPLFFKMQPSTLENFLLNLKGKLPADLPVWRDELYLEFHRGTFTTKADQKHQNRQMEVLLGNAEKLSAIAYLTSQIPYPQANLETAWQGLLLNQFHDILPGTSIPEVFTDADHTWAEVQEICVRILDPVNASYQQTSCLQAWNFLNWQRSQLVRLTDNSLYWLENIPSFGFAELETVAIRETNQPLSITSENEKFYLENIYLRVEIDAKTGVISQIFDKRSQKNILQSPSKLQFFEDKGQYWDAWNIDPNYETKQLESASLSSIKILDNSSLLVSIQVIQKFHNSTFVQEIQLTAFEQFITINSFVDWQEEHTLVKVNFPVNWQASYATYEIPMGTIQRSTLGETPEDQAKWEVPAQYWADISSGHDALGLAVINDSKYGYDAKPDCLRLSLLRSPNWPSPNSDRGLHQFTYRLVPHQGDWRKANIVQLAQELNNPVILKHSSIQGNNRSFINISAPNIILSAFKRSQDQSGWIIRLYESHGQSAETNIEISSQLLQISNVWECDLMERKNNLISLVNNKNRYFKAIFLPYEIKTFLVL
ncbi:MAG: alpha-mannosidase [Pseudanabaena sp.]